jgi:CHAT domain-containing protein
VEFRYYIKYREEYLKKISLDIIDILSLVEDNQIFIIPIITTQGSAIVVLQQKQKQVSKENIIWLDNITKTDLDQLLVHSGWDSLYKDDLDNRDKKFINWHLGSEKIKESLWKMFVYPIYAKFGALQVNNGADIIFMPQGVLSLLPLHTASGYFKDQQHSLLRDFTFSVVPSFHSLQLVRKNINSDYPVPNWSKLADAIFCIIDPNSNLPFANLEAKLITRYFSENKLYANEEANLGNITSGETLFYPYVHFSGHGFYDHQDIFNSGLYLSNSDKLTLNDLLVPGGFAAAMGRIVVLSACDTGITETTNLPNEYIGLPMLFIAAGFPAVIASLWKINDLSTALLMDRFYYLHIEKRLRPQLALKEAQLWLANVTHDELERNYSDAYTKNSGQLDGSSRPYEHEYYWAGFQYIGI